MSPLRQADKIQPPDVWDLPPTRSILSPPLTRLTYGLQVIEGLHRAGVEFRYLSEDFDTATANGKLQLQMVLAFSVWWRNSIRDRSVAGQAKARTEGRFPGRRPSLTEQQREYIRTEQSKGVSQQDLAKLLEVSRWTIQQADRLGWVENAASAECMASWQFDPIPARAARKSPASAACPPCWPALARRRS